jgi:membrane protease YdiL (CAAX protease family)
VPSPEPATAGLGYHELHRLGRAGVVRALGGVLLLAGGVLVSTQVVVLVVAAVAASFGAKTSVDPVTPTGLAAVNLAWAAAIPVTWLVLRTFQRLPERWLASVAGRIRWGWLGVCLALSTVALFATVVVATVFPQQPGAEVGGTVNDLTARTRDFALVILLLTPLQAAGEEYAFRGYLTQAFGGLVRGRYAAVLAVVVPSLLFALAHGAQDAPVFVDRLAFGLVAGTLTILTGGLEAGVAMHVLNNWLAFGLALLFGDMDSVLTPTGGTWWTLPSTLTQSLVYLGIVVAAGRALRLQVRRGGVVLDPPGTSG